MKLESYLQEGSSTKKPDATRKTNVRTPAKDKKKEEKNTGSHNLDKTTINWWNSHSAATQKAWVEDHKDGKIAALVNQGVLKFGQKADGSGPSGGGSGEETEQPSTNRAHYTFDIFKLSGGEVDFSGISKKHIDEVSSAIEDALEKKLHYGKIKEGSFGKKAVQSMAKYVLNAARNGEKDPDILSREMYKGWQAAVQEHFAEDKNEAPEQGVSQQQPMETPAPEQKTQTPTEQPKGETTPAPTGQVENPDTKNLKGEQLPEQIFLSKVHQTTPVDYSKINLKEIKAEEFDVKKDFPFMDEKDNRLFRLYVIEKNDDISGEPIVQNMICMFEPGVKDYEAYIRRNKEDGKGYYFLDYVEFVNPAHNEAPKNRIKSIIESAVKTCRTYNLDYMSLVADIQVGKYGWAVAGMKYYPEMEMKTFGHTIESRREQFINWCRNKKIKVDEDKILKFNTPKEFATFEVPGKRLTRKDIVIDDAIQGNDFSVGKAYMLDKQGHGYWYAKYDIPKGEKKK